MHIGSKCFYQSTSSVDFKAWLIVGIVSPSEGGSTLPYVAGYEVGRGSWFGYWGTLRVNIYR